MSEDEGYVYRRIETTERVKIPEGFVKCPACRGSGELRIRYGPAHDRGQFGICWYCGGKGFIPKEVAQELEKTNDWFIQREKKQNE